MTPARDPTPVPGTVQAIWHATLDALRAAGHGQAAALWGQTYPTARSPETFTICVPTPFVAAELAKARLAPLVGDALARAIGHPVRLCTHLHAGPTATQTSESPADPLNDALNDASDDPLITEMIRRLRAKHRGGVPPRDNVLDEWGAAR